MDKPMTFIEWCASKGVIPYSLGIEAAYEAGQQSMQAKVDDLQKELQSAKESAYKAGFYDGRNGTPCEYVRLEAERDELQKRVDTQTKHVEMALLAVKDIYKSAIDEFHNWDVFNEKEPKLCDHLQNLSVATGELEQALKGEYND